MDELIETFGSDDDTWSTAKLMDTDSHEIIAESPVEEPELKEVEPVIEEENLHADVDALIEVGVERKKIKYIL